MHPRMPPLMPPLMPMAAAATCGVLVGAATVASRFVIEQTEPASLALMRYVIGCACLVGPLLMARPVRFARRDIVPIALLGIAQFAILVALLNFGLQTVGSALAALIFATLPLITMLFAWAVRLEDPSFYKTLGVALTIAGVGLAVAGKLALPGVGADGWIGEIAIFGATATGAVCSVLYRPYLRRYPALPVSALAMFASVLFLAGLAAWEDFFDAWPRFTTGGWLAILFIGLNSGVGYYLWLWALQHASPTRVTVFMALSPVTATILGGLLLAEDLGPSFLLGLTCVVAGLWLAHRREC